MVDDFQRQVLYHGVNVVYKIPPYYPQLNGFDPDNSLCAEDIQFLRGKLLYTPICTHRAVLLQAAALTHADNGFNVVRLFVSWAGTELSPGVYNYSYLNVLRSIVDDLASYNVSTILDAHQV